MARRLTGVGRQFEARGRDKGEPFPATAGVRAVSKTTFNARASYTEVGPLHLETFIGAVNDALAAPRPGGVRRLPGLLNRARSVRALNTRDKVWRVQSAARDDRYSFLRHELFIYATRGLLGGRRLVFSSSTWSASRALVESPSPSTSRTTSCMRRSRKAWPTVRHDPMTQAQVDRLLLKQRLRVRRAKSPIYESWRRRY